MVRKKGEINSMHDIVIFIMRVVLVFDGSRQILEVPKEICIAVLDHTNHLPGP